jgi:chromosome partitioning protein
MVGRVEPSTCKIVAVFSAKGGVGKSTTVMMLAEALSGFHGKKVLVIDADPQTSVSVMLTPKREGVPDGLRDKTWDLAQHHKRTLVDFFVAACRKGTVNVADYAIGSVSDVQEARSVDLMPGNMELALFESAFVEAGGQKRLAEAVHDLLQLARSTHDVVLIDCSPGLSALTLSWLQHADALLSPITPNFLGIRSLAVVNHLRELFENENRRFAPRLGTLITLDSDTRAERAAREMIAALDRTEGLQPFVQQVPRSPHMLNAAEYQFPMRSFAKKYPKSGKHDLALIIKSLAAEVLKRTA